MAKISPKVRGSWHFFVMLSFAVLLLPLPWIVSMVLAAAFHELCHWSVIRLLGGRVPLITFGGNGASMYMDNLGRGESVLCALAGPVGSVLLVLLGQIFPRLAFCGVVQGFYNLLPVYPMDGGRILYGCLSGVISDKRMDLLSRILRFSISVAAMALGIYATFFRKLGLFPVFLGVFLCARVSGSNQNVLTNCYRRSKMTSPAMVRQMKFRRDLE